MARGIKIIIIVVLLVVPALFLVRCLHNDAAGNNDANDNSIVVFFSYPEIIRGYKVSGQFMPYGDNTETGRIRIDFTRDGKCTFTWTSEDVYCDYNTCRIAFSNDFNGWVNGQEYVFEYPGASFENPYYDATHPLGYHQPFCFVDIDFDGYEELLISDYYRGRGGNTYTAYKIDGSNLVELDKNPYLNICNMTEFIPERKEIIHWCSSGADYSAYLTYCKGCSPTGNIPSVPSEMMFDELESLLKEAAEVDGYYLRSVKVCVGTKEYDSK